MVCQLAGSSLAAGKLAQRMQVLKDNLIYSLGVDGVLEADRQILVEEQKSCRALARKHSIETNRRRKALEERRKLWDVQEERLRENILQQRKQRVQDATERFQRAHLPPSQRRRQSIKKSYPNIEDALRHIQGTFSSYTRQSSFLSSSSTISRSCTPSPKPPMGSNFNRHQRTLSAVEAYTKLMQEQTMQSFKNSHLLFLSELQETQVREQEASSPQADHVHESHHSDSLSSLDSLENEDFNRNNSRNIACSSHSSLEQKMFDCKKTQITQGNTNDSTPISTNASSSDNLLQMTQVCSSPPCKSWQQEAEEANKKLQNLPEATRGATTTEKTLNTEAQASHHHHSFLAFIGTDTGSLKYEENTRNEIASQAQIKASPDSMPLDFACLLQNGKLLDNRLHVTNKEDKSLPSKDTSATKVNLPIRNYNHKEDFCEAHEVMKETIASQTIFKSINQSLKAYDLMNNLDTNSHSEPNADRTKQTEPIGQMCNSNTLEPSDILKCHAISGTSFKISEVRVIKGILKKQSKYVSGDAKTMHGAGHLVFTKQVALSIRDSVELTKMRAEEGEGSKKMKKKLRWLDEVNNEVEDKEINTNIVQQNHAKSKYALHPLQQKSNLADHQESMTAVPGAPRSGPNLTPSDSTSYQFTKQAWADVEVQGGKLQDQEEKVKVQKGSIRTGCPRVPRRVRSARIGSGSVSSCSRKGTVIRPQSAAELNHIPRSQGRVMVPRPPPRTDTMDGITGEPAGYYLDHINAKQGLPMEQAFYREHSDCLNPSITDGFRTDSGVMFTPFPPSYHPSSESASKGSTTSGQQGSKARVGRRGGAMLYDEKGLCLDRTPTDEEISQLWHGVRSALSTNNARANLSQVTINGDSLINGVRAVTRLGGFFLSPSNARNVIRRTNPENTRSRRRCVEPNRQAPGLGNRRLPLPTQAEYQLSPWPCKYDLTQIDEGLERTAQSSLAELPGETSMTHTDVMAAMETIQTQKQQQQHGLTNISLEEQKILLSLDRLNNRLQYVQEYAGGNTAVKGLLHDVMAYGGEGKTSNPSKYRIASANSRFRSQKKF